MKTVIYIASDVRSGSTMLDNLLSNHPQAESMGELAQLTSHLNKGKVGASSNWICTCGMAMDACPVWSHVATVYKQEHGHPLEDVETNVGRDARSRLFHVVMLLTFLLPIKKVRRWLLRYAYCPAILKGSGRRLYQIIGAFRQTTGAEIVIDSSKTVEQLHALIAAKPADISLKLVHIVRDGRAVLYSKIKRSEQLVQYGWTFALIPAIRQWNYVNVQILNTMSLLSPKDAITVRYEDLCKNHKTVLRSICEHFGIVFDEAMLYLLSEDKHNVGGSPHRFTWNAGTPIRLDERWKGELSLWHRVLYSIIAGPMHKRLGYGWR